MGHEERFPPLRLKAGSGFSKKTFAGTPGSEEDAPFPAIGTGVCHY
jgi:hypothetical protein